MTQEIRVFPKNSRVVEEKGKKYVIFPETGTGIMLADKLYHTTGTKMGQRLTLTDKMIKTYKCPQPGKGWYASESTTV